MSIITSQINNQINDLQSVASALADYDPDGDRTLEEGLKPFLISACIGMVEKATMMRTDREAMMQYILDQTELGFAIPYDAKTIYRKLQERNSDAYQTLYGMANGWDLPGNTVSWIVYTVMAVNFGREDIAENFLPEVSNLMKFMGDLLMKPFPHVPANRAFYLYMKETIERFNQEMRDRRLNTKISTRAFTRRNKKCAKNIAMTMKHWKWKKHWTTLLLQMMRIHLI